MFLLQKGWLHTKMLKYDTKYKKCVWLKSQFSPPAAHVCFESLHTDTLLQQRQRRWMWWSWHVRNSVLSDLPPQPGCGPGPGRANWFGLKKTCQIDRELRRVMFSTRSLRCPIKSECTKQELCQTFKYGVRVWSCCHDGLKTVCSCRHSLKLLAVKYEGVHAVV